MVKDAEQHASDDAKRRESVETKNQADNLAYQTEKLLKEQGEKISADKKVPVEESVKALREAIKTDDADRIKAAMDDLNAKMQAFSAELYAQAKASGEAAGAGAGAHAHAGGPSDGGAEASAGGAGGGKDEEVIDADFTMMDDDKKK